MVKARRRLLGIEQETLAAEAGLSVELLQALERGDFDPRSLHQKARAVLERRLDITL